MSFVQHVTAGKSVYGKRLPEKGLKGRASAGQPEDMGMNKRHRTRQALHKRQLTADTLLYLTPPEGLSEDEDEDSGDEEEEEQGDSGHPLPTPGAAIEIPVVRTLTDEELATRMAPPPPILSEQQPAADEEEEDISDAHYRRLHLVFELKEQALREQSVRTGGARRLVQRSGRQVSSTELLLAPSVERKLTREDHKMVLGKTDVPEVPDDRLVEIEEKLEEVEKTYERNGHYARYYLHTRWKPAQVIVDTGPPPSASNAAVAAESGSEAPASDGGQGPGEPPPKRRLVIRLQRLPDGK